MSFVYFIDENVCHCAGQDEIIAEEDRNGIASSPVGPRLVGLPVPSPVQMPVTFVEPVNKEIHQPEQEPEVRRKV